MITNQLKNDIDRLWTEFWTGGITNPLTVIEQISFLMFARLLDIDETRFEKLAGRTGKSPHKNFGPDQQNLRWKNWSEYGGEEMLRHVRDQVFPHLRDLGGKNTTFGEYMKDATCLIPKASLLNSAVIQIGLLPLGNSDIKGDLYEFMLSKLSTAGINGQFRTPRHIIKLMVELLDPKPTEVVGDPACGTAGFLVGTMEYLRRQYSSPELVETFEDGSKGYPGDRLEPFREHIQNGLFHGFDFDVTMLRIAAMNLMLHGVENPDIHYQDTLSKQFPEKFNLQAEAGFDAILANPPFKGSLDEEDVHPSLLKKVKTNAEFLAEDDGWFRVQAGPYATRAQERRPLGHHRAGRRAVRLQQGACGLASAPDRRKPTGSGDLAALGRIQALRRGVHRHPGVHQGRAHR